MASFRPPQRRVPPLQVAAESRYRPPATNKIEIPIELLPNHGPRAPAWESVAPLPLEPIFENEYVEVSSDVHDTVHRAELRDCPTKDQLRAAPPLNALLDSDGVLLSENGRVATHRWPVQCGPTRQAVLSANWVHRSHEPAVRTWNVRARRATQDSGDIYFGLTQATSFEHSGKSCLFDVRGNFCMGWHPLALVLTHDAAEIQWVRGARKGGNFMGSKNDAMKITADLEQQVMKVETGEGSFVQYPLCGWEHARLCVTLSFPGDEIELCE